MAPPTRSTKRPGTPPNNVCDHLTTKKRLKEETNRGQPYKQAYVRKKISDNVYSHCQVHIVSQTLGATLHGRAFFIFCLDTGSIESSLNSLGCKASVSRILSVCLVLSAFVVKGARGTFGLVIPLGLKSYTRLILT